MDEDTTEQTSSEEMSPLISRDSSACSSLIPSTSRDNGACNEDLAMLFLLPTVVIDVYLLITKLRSLIYVVRVK